MNPPPIPASEPAVPAKDPIPNDIADVAIGENGADEDEEEPIRRNEQTL